MSDGEIDILGLISRARESAGSLRDHSIQFGLQRLHEKVVRNEWYVVLVGETSAGKSTWVNSLLGTPLLPATPDPTTGIGVEIRFSKMLSTPRFLVVARDGAERDISRDDFQSLCRDPRDVARLRLCWPMSELNPRIGHNTGFLDGLVLVDSPGYNSLIESHGDILSDLIPEADALISLVDFRWGVRPVEKDFFETTRSVLGGDGLPPVLVAVNHVPSDATQAVTRKISAMRDQMAQVLKGPCEMFPLRSTKVGDHFEVFSDLLIDALRSIAESPIRRAAVKIGTLNVLSSAIVSMLEQALPRAEIEVADENKIMAMKMRVAEYRKANEDGNEEVSKFQAKVSGKLTKIAEAHQNNAWSKISSEIDDASRLWEKRQVHAFVFEHLIPCEISLASDAVQELFLAEFSGLENSLDGMVTSVDEIGVPINPTNDDRNFRAAQILARRGASAAAGAAVRLFTEYLAALGGAGGVNAGFVNFAKKAVSKTGQLGGKSFGRPVYRNVGRILRRFGITMSRVATVFVTVATEVVIKIYDVARWKKRLRAIVARILDIEDVGEPIEDWIIRKVAFWRKRTANPFTVLKDEAHAALTEAVAETRRVFEGNIKQRIGVIEDALRTQAASPRDGGGRWRSIVDDLVQVHDDIETVRSACHAQDYGGAA